MTAGRSGISAVVGDSTWVEGAVASQAMPLTLAIGW